jgi:spermidine synthase
MNANTEPTLGTDPLLSDMVAIQIFEGGSVSYAYTTIPTYPSGQIGFMLCCKARPTQGSGSGDAPVDPRVARQTPGNIIPPLGVKELQ